MTERGTGHPGAPVVSFEEVSKVYGQVRAVDGLSLDLRRGETVAFLGPKGAGKYRPPTIPGYSPAGARGRR